MFVKRTVHQDVDEENLHCIQRIFKMEHHTECDQSQCCNRRAQLERQEVLNIVKYRFPCQRI